MRRVCIRWETIARARRLLLRTDDERGVELVEFAFILPLLLTLLIGIFWVGRAYNVYQTITRAAREGAQTAVARTCACCGGCGSGNVLPTVSSVENAVLNSLTASSI